MKAIQRGLIAFLLPLLCHSLNAQQKEHAVRATRVQLQSSSTRITVPLKVTVSPAGWTQNISLCNTNNQAIPLKNVEFAFNFTGAISSIWGSPWLDWKLLSHQGTTYVFTGGNSWTQSLPPDSSCTQPITLSFSSSPSTPTPTGPYLFKAEGASPSSLSSARIALPIAPATGLPNPTITIKGNNFEQSKAISWGNAWQIDNLATGSYNVSASSVNNGQQFYTATPTTLTVILNQVATMTIAYKAVPQTPPSGTLSPLVVSLVTPPSTSKTFLFTGKQNTLSKTITTNPQTLSLPNDTYTISSTTPGYSVSFNPNPITLPTTSKLIATYNPITASAANFGGYFESWRSRWTSDPAKTELANLPSYVTHVYLSFARPETNYQAGSLNIAATGLSFNYDNGALLKQAVTLLHQKNPRTKVILAVGGATYTNWAQYNAASVAAIVKDFGLDGVDIDYEPNNPGCQKGADGRYRCATDSQLQTIIRNTRAALPRPYLLTMAGWSIGAYGEDQWATATPQGDYTGLLLPLFRSTAASDIDLINVMSYDASNAYNPQQALLAYTNYYKGPVCMGVEVPPEAWGGHVYTLNEVTQLANAVISTAKSQGRTPGMMIWSLQKTPNGTITAENPSAQMMATTICNSLGMSNCSAVLIN